MGPFFKDKTLPLTTRILGVLTSSGKSDLTMSIVPRDSGAGDERSFSDEIFDRHHQLFQHFRDRFNFPSFHDDRFFFPTPFSSFPFPFSTSRSLPYSELSIETEGSLNSRLECKEIPEAYLFVADLPPGVERDQVIVQVESSDGSPALRISGDGGGGGWGRFNWKMKLPPNANLEQLGSSIENGVLTVVVPKVGVWGATPPLPPPQSRNVRVVEITGSD